MKRMFLGAFMILLCLVFSLSSCDEIMELFEETSESHVCSFGEWKIEKEATCTRSGSMVRCCDCGEEEVSKIKAEGHSWVAMESRPGWTDGQYCKVCGKILEEQESMTESATVEETQEESSGNYDPGINQIGNPGEYNYTICDETVYVNNLGSAITLRTADYEAKGAIPHGTELKRIGLSTDEANYWSRVIYEGETYYVPSKFLTDIKNPDEGFVAVDKIVVVNDNTGSLNIRNLPTYSGSVVIGWALAGEETKVIAENTESGWYKIEFVNYSCETVIGYIRSDANLFVTDNTHE